MTVQNLKLLVAERQVAAPADWAPPQRRAVVKRPRPVAVDQLPGLVWALVGGCFVWAMAMFALRFGGPAEGNYMLSVAAITASSLFILPTVLARAGRLEHDNWRMPLKRFLAGRFATCSGEVHGGEALAQILIAPLAVALAATMMAVIIEIVH